MSISLLTNYSATLAMNNVSSASDKLQSSLNRLSSGSKINSPSDDAGGLAVSTKMSAAIKRQAAADTNLSNAISYLQTQDGALSTAGKILDRMSELKTLSEDGTKNASDLSSYETEFSALREQLGSIESESFNGVSLFSSSALETQLSGDAEAALLDIGSLDLFGSVSSPEFSTFSDNFSDASNWTNTGTGNTSVSASSGYLTLTTLIGTGDAEVTSNDSYSGAYEINFNVTTNGPMEVDIGGTTVAVKSAYGFNSPTRITVDESGDYAVYYDGSDTASSTGSGISGSNQVTIRHTRQPSTSSNIHVSNFSIESTAATGTDAFSVSNAGSLSSLDLSTITSALEEVASHRASNGARQSRIQFAREQLTVGRANLEAANSRIIDVDVATESTQLARFNILQQAGVSMLSQANQSSQIALKLIG